MKQREKEEILITMTESGCHWEINLTTDYDYSTIGMGSTAVCRRCHVAIKMKGPSVVVLRKVVMWEWRCEVFQ